MTTRYEQKMYLDIDKGARALVRIADALEDLVEVQRKQADRQARIERVSGSAGNASAEAGQSVQQ
jgi:hypothetical protein